MAVEQAAQNSSAAAEPANQRKVRPWERTPAPPAVSRNVRDTFHIDALSPGAEILAKHAALLEEQTAADEQSSGVICF